MKDPELSEEKLAWAVGNNRDYYRVKKVINQGFEDSFGIESKDFYYNEGCLHFEHLTLLIFDGAAVSCHLAGAVDYIMVRKNGQIDLNLILRN